MSDRRIVPHCAWAMKETHKRKLPAALSWLIVTIAERVDRNTLQWWSSLEAMMADTRLSRRKVQYLLRRLPPDLIGMRRGAEGRWVFTLLRPAVETPDCEAEEVVRGAQYAPPDPPRGAQCAPYPLKEDSPEEEEDARTRATPAPVEILATDIEAVPAAREPFPDEDPELRPEEVAEIKAAGHDPAELRDEVREWAHRQNPPATSDYWPHVMVKWARQTPPKRRRSQRGAANKPAPKPRILQTVAAFTAMWEGRA